MLLDEVNNGIYAGAYIYLVHPQAISIVCIVTDKPYAVAFTLLEELMKALHRIEAPNK